MIEAVTARRYVEDIALVLKCDTKDIIPTLHKLIKKVNDLHFMVGNLQAELRIKTDMLVEFNKDSDNEKDSN